MTDVFFLEPCWGILVSCLSPFCKAQKLSCIILRHITNSDIFRCTINRSRRTTRWNCCSDNIVDIRTVRAISKSRCMHGMLTTVVRTFWGGKQLVRRVYNVVQVIRARTTVARPLCFLNHHFHSYEKSWSVVQPFTSIWRPRDFVTQHFPTGHRAIYPGIPHIPKPLRESHGCCQTNSTTKTAAFAER